MENEARSCSMDFGCITPEYVYRMWGGSVAIEEIANAMKVMGAPAAQNPSKINKKIIQTHQELANLRILSRCIFSVRV